MDVIRKDIFSKTVKLADNQYKLTASCSPLHFLNDNGQLEDIDINLRLDNGNIVADKLPYKFSLNRLGIGFKYYSKKYGVVKVSLIKIGDFIVSDNFRYQYEMRGNNISFNDIVPDVEIAFQILPTMVKTWRIINTETAPRSFSWKIECDNEAAFSLIKNDVIGFDDARNNTTKRKAQILVESKDVDKNTKIYVETWTGRVRFRDRDTHIFSWKDIVRYPVIIDPTITEEVVSNSDDGTEEVGLTNFYPNLLEIGMVVTSSANTPYHAGIRFQSVPIAQGVVIQSGGLTLNVINSFGDGYASGYIYGYDVNSTDPWQSSPNYRMPSTMTQTTATTPFPRATANGLHTYNVTSIVQEIVDRAGWASNNHMSFGILNKEATNRRTALEDFNAAGTNEPLLEILYADAPATPTSGSIPLYINGHLPGNSGATLYIYGQGTGISGMPLYTLGSIPSNSGMTLYIYGNQPQNTGITLYAYGQDSGNLGNTLFIEGIYTNNSGMSLYMYGYDSGNLGRTLYINGVGATGNMPLYIYGGLNISSGIPLYINNQPTTSNITLYIGDLGNRIENSMTLFLKNPGVDSGMELVVWGGTFTNNPDITEGGVPKEGSIYLFIQGLGVTNNVPLYLNSPTGLVNGNIPLFLTSLNTENSGMPLYMPTDDTKNSNLKLYTHGF